jgi:hypothetical protein
MSGGIGNTNFLRKLWSIVSTVFAEIRADSHTVDKFPVVEYHEDYYDLK